MSLPPTCIPNEVPLFSHHSHHYRLGQWSPKWGTHSRGGSSTVKNPKILYLLIASNEIPVSVLFYNIHTLSYYMYNSIYIYYLYYGYMQIFFFLMKKGVQPTFLTWTITTVSELILFLCLSAFNLCSKQ